MKVSQLSGRRHRQAAQFVKLHLDQRFAFAVGPDQLPGVFIQIPISSYLVYTLPCLHLPLPKAFHGSLSFT